MLEEKRISAHQIKVLVTLFFIGTSIIDVPSVLVVFAKTSGWIIATVGLIVGLLIMKLYVSLGEMFNDMTLVQYSRKILGRGFGTVLSLWFVSFLLLNTSDLLSITGSFVGDVIIPETPRLVIDSLFMTVVIFGSRLGIEVIARAGEILYDWAIGGAILLILLSVSMVKFENILPIFDVGIGPMMRGIVYYQSTVSLTFVVFLMIFPACVSKGKEVKKSFYKGMLIAGVIFIIIVLICISAMGAATTARELYPTYTLAKKINIGKFMERLEAITAMVWVIAIFFNTIIYFYAGTIGFTQIFKLKDYKCFTIPFGIIIVILSQIRYPNAAYFVNWNRTTWVYYALTNGFFIPLFLLIIGKFKSK